MNEGLYVRLLERLKAIPTEWSSLRAVVWLGAVGVGVWTGQLAAENVELWIMVLIGLIDLVKPDVKALAATPNLEAQIGVKPKG